MELLKNSITQINKTASIDRFHEAEMDGKLIFGQLCCCKKTAQLVAYHFLKLSKVLYNSNLKVLLILSAEAFS
ncbi:hypothetical protein LBHA_00245 [Leptospira borgpetersenii serovar Hardjo]|nr:hypothetical protein LBK30_00240 [Leptospira borgpetersenii serovar Hardjo]AMX66603.1 hypothetical protein LBHA_00245 [Leptospira borgpetersenii serovar Hardjo]AMX69865.1 hypothetical protein LBHB_00515 [Leptospira borgpetersenii serovar Hardjo]